MRKRTILLLLLAAEAVLFSASIFKYFTGDSLYFFSHSADFLHLDDLSTYRPLTLVIFRYLMEPLAGFTPLPYHLMALAAHMGVSVMVYFLLKRLASSDAGVAAGLVFFGLHSTAFYISYDATFLPDFSMALFAAGSFLAYAAGRRTLSLLLFIPALFCKESAVAIPVGIAAIGYLSGRPRRELAPFGALTAVYLAFQLYLHDGWLYPSGKSAYRFALGPASLWLKLKYLPWLVNMPADWFRQGGWMLLPIALMIVPLLWFARRKSDTVACLTTWIACGAWMLAALAPALPVAQVPMQHNLYISLIAGAVLISRCVAGVSRRVGWTLAILFVAATALQIRANLRTSWVGEGSDITEASLDAVMRAHPVLPPGARFYVLPAKIPGGINWYFDDESLFRRVYHDQSLRVFYADLGRLPPPGFEQQAGVMILSYFSGRLYDVTAAYKRDALDPDSRALLNDFPRAKLESGLAWKPDELVQAKAAGIVSVAMGDDLRGSLVSLPQTRVRFPVDHPLPAGALLELGVAAMGKQRQAAVGRIAWSGQTGSAQEIARVFLDAGGQWFDGRFDLSRFAGQTGTLEIDNLGGRNADWIAWSNLRIESAASPYLAYESPAHPLESLGVPLLASFSGAKILSTIAWKDSEMPEGQPASLAALSRAGSERTALVELPQTTVRIPVSALPAAPVTLKAGAARVGKQRGAAQGRILWEDAAGPHELVRAALDPIAQDSWFDTSRDISEFAGRAGTLVFENTGSRDSDWIAWSRLQLVAASGAGDAPASNPLLVDFLHAPIHSDVAWRTEDLADGHAASLKLVDRGGELHETMLELPSTRVDFPVTIPEHARLHLAVTIADGDPAASAAAIDFESNGETSRIFEAFLDRTYDGTHWRHRDVDLSALAGRSGTLIFRNTADRTRAAVAWGDVRIQQDAPPALSSIGLMDLLATARLDFDRTENYPNFENFGTPGGGKSAFIWWDNPALPARLSMVTIAGARVSFDLPALPARPSLAFAVSHGTGVGDGVRGKIFWNDVLIYDHLVPPWQRNWSEVVIPLPVNATAGGTLRIEASSGPKRNTIGDWLAWSGLRIVPN